VLDESPTVTGKAAWTVRDPAMIGSKVNEAFDLAGSAHRGPVFLDIPMDVLFTPSVAVPKRNDCKRSEDTSSREMERAAELFRSAKLRHFEAPVAGTARDEGEIRGLRVAETGQTKFVRRDFGEPNQWVGLAGSAAQLWFAEQSTR